MACITIEDLPQNDDLDRAAMQSILGGGLGRSPPRRMDEAGADGGPIVEYPPGFGRRDKVRAVLAPTSR